MAWRVPAFRIFGKSFYLQWMCLCHVPVNTGLLLFVICIVPVLARMAMGTLAARQLFSNSIVMLLYMVQCCATTEGPQGLCWRDFPYFLCPISLKFLSFPWACGIVQNGICVLPGILFWSGCLLVP